MLPLALQPSLLLLLLLTSPVLGRASCSRCFSGRNCLLKALLLCNNALKTQLPRLRHQLRLRVGAVLDRDGDLDLATAILNLHLASTT